MIKRLIWLVWGIITVSLGTFYAQKFFWSDDKSALLIGETTYGHYQIELACSSCHTEPFGGTEILQDACLSCHQNELALADDSHPKSKFNDPRNADRIEILDARYCITCHSEHKQQQTLAMGLTVPSDYCFHCHQEIFTERPSHVGMEFDTCETSGCHNYHDNRALYEDFLVTHGNEPDFLEDPIFSPLFKPQVSEKSLSSNDVDAPVQYQNSKVIEQWLTSAHAVAGINCTDCHQQQAAWIAKPGLSQCQDCHQFQVAGFTSGKHGMRLSELTAESLNDSLTAMTPASARQHTFKVDSIHNQQNCNACHSDHQFDTQQASVNACLSCHNDEHSLNYLDSPHGKTWLKAMEDDSFLPQAVSCASCHLPRETDSAEANNDSEPQKQYQVQHNQNANLRPNEKMIRGVCMNCHGLGFSIDSLADKQLIQSNFSGRAEHHIESIDMALKRAQTH